MVADGNQLGPDHRSETMSGYQKLGFIGKGDAQKFYYIKYDTEMGKFEYVYCKDAKPPQTCDFDSVPKPAVKDAPPAP